MQELFFGCYADPVALGGVHDLPALLEEELHALGGAAAPSRAVEPAHAAGADGKAPAPALA